MSYLVLIGQLITLSSKIINRSTLKEKKKYVERLADLKIQYEREMHKPLDQQNDYLIEDLLIQIKEIAKVAEHESDIINNPDS